ncbi:MAG: hypothetical protein AB7V62_02215 [Thermoleophilia bacterium]
MTRGRLGLIGLACLLAAAVGVALALTVTSGDSASAQRWGEPTRVPVPGGAVGTARVAVGDDGSVDVVFAVRRDGESQLRHISRPAGGDWTAPATVTTSPFRIIPDAVAIGPDGDVAATWLLSGGRRSLLMAATMPHEGEWTPAQALSRVGNAMHFTRLVVAQDGATTVVARGLDGPGLWAVRHEPSGGWAAARRITPPGLGTDAPATTIAPDGRIGVVALAKRPGVPRTLTSILASPSGTWGPPRPIPATTGARSPLAAFSTDGTLVAGWTREAAGRVTVESATLAGVSWTAARRWDRLPRSRAGAPVITGADGPQLAWTRWISAPQDRLAEVRAAAPASSGAAVTIAAPEFPPVDPDPATPADIVYGQPPLHLIGGTGTRPLLLGVQPGTGGSQVWASTVTGAAWEAPTLLASGAGFAFPVAAGAGDGHEVAVWAAGPPFAAADRILMADR